MWYIEFGTLDIFCSAYEPYYTLNMATLRTLSLCCSSLSTALHTFNLWTYFNAVTKSNLETADSWCLSGVVNDKLLSLFISSLHLTNLQFQAFHCHYMVLVAARTYRIYHSGYNVVVVFTTSLYAYIATVNYKNSSYFIPFYGIL